MNEKLIVTQEIQDLTRAVDDITDAVKSLRSTTEVREVRLLAGQPEIKLDVKIPEAPPAKVVVNVPTQAVNLQLKQNAPAPVAYRVTVTSRDAAGFIETFVIEPVV